MGDFDRNAKPAEGGQTKKMIMVGVLAAVLAGVLGMQMMKGGPAPAAAASGQPGAVPEDAAPAADESPDVLRAALLKDPTSSLLVAGTRTPTLAAVDRNPFGMSTAWRKSLTRDLPVEPPAYVAPTQNTNTTIVDPPPVPVAQPLALKATDYKLAMIMVLDGHLTALVNNSPVSVGSRIRDAVVVDVRANAVVLRHKDFPDGPTLELQIKPN